MNPSLIIAIRRGALADLAEVQRLNHALYQYEQTINAYADSYELNWSYIDAGANYFTSYLGAAPGSIVLVAEHRGQIIGYIAGAYRTLATRRPDLIAEIENMFVDEAYRSRHAGRQLLDAFSAWAKSHGVGRLRVAAFTKNRSAIDFYHQNGFEDLELYMEIAL